MAKRGDTSNEWEKRPRQYAQEISRNPVELWKGELEKVPGHLRKMTRLHLMLVWERNREAD